MAFRYALLLDFRGLGCGSPAAGRRGSSGVASLLLPERRLAQIFLETAT